MRRRRPLGRKIYTISLLLEKQPKAFQKGKYYSLLMSYLNNSFELYTLRFNKRCYSLLNNAIIKPEHLANFYRTYKLPVHPFFPLFFMEKKTYLREREEKKKERQVYVDQSFLLLPAYVKEFFTRLKELEAMYHPANKSPLYTLSLYAKTKKKADLYSRLTHKEWITCFESFLLKLHDRYRRIPRAKSDKLLAGFILFSVPASLCFLPDKPLIKQKYRALSKQYHPDFGDDSDTFIKIKWARDVLLSD